MSKITWHYINENTKIQINKISNQYTQGNIIEEGTDKNGKITLTSVKNFDEYWGPESKIEITWETKEPEDYHQGLKVKETIRMFSAIEVLATKKENKWHLSHEMTIWFGNRQQIKRKRFYASRIIHSILYCELSNRIFEIHATCIGNRYVNYEPLIMEIMNSFQCHS